MSKNPNIKKVVIIGSGPIIIGQATEFDYAGTQACRAIREEGVEVVLINSNPATIMTDKQIADKVYIEPLTVETIKKVIIKEKPDSILPTLGGQNALNLSEEGARGTLLVRLDGVSYLVHLDVVSSDEQVYTDEAYEAGEFDAHYSGAANRLSSYTIVSDVLSIETTTMLMF